MSSKPVFRFTVLKYLFLLLDSCYVRTAKALIRVTLQLQRLIGTVAVCLCVKNLLFVCPNSTTEENSAFLNGKESLARVFILFIYLFVCLFVGLAAKNRKADININKQHILRKSNKMTAF